MTAQLHEKLRYHGQTLNLATEPLKDYFELAGIKPPRGMCTALWRGYVGTWEIVGDRLYLTKMDSPYGQTITMEQLFPGFPDRVFAHWYTGTLVIHTGDCVEYEHGGFGGVYEKRYEISFQDGCVTGPFPLIPKSDSENEYMPMAFTVFGADAD